MCFSASVIHHTKAADDSISSTRFPAGAAEANSCSAGAAVLLFWSGKSIFFKDSAPVYHHRWPEHLLHRCLLGKQRWMHQSVLRHKRVRLRKICFRWQKEISSIASIALWHHLIKNRYDCACKITFDSLWTFGGIVSFFFFFNFNKMPNKHPVTFYSVRKLWGGKYFHYTCTAGCSIS